jgi:hypothetical protein
MDRHFPLNCLKALKQQNALLPVMEEVAASLATKSKKCLATSSLVFFYMLNVFLESMSHIIIVNVF